MRRRVSKQSCQKLMYDLAKTYSYDLVWKTVAVLGIGI